MEQEELKSSTPDEQPRGMSVRRRIPTLLSVAAIAIGGMGIAACGEEESAGPESGGAAADGADVGEEESSEGASAQPTEVTLSELLERPSTYVGQVVTVSGQVSDQEVARDDASKSAFTVGEDVDEDLLILPTAELTPEGISDQSVVEVQGTVREVDDVLVEEEDLLFEQNEVDDEFLGEFSDEIAIVATRIDTDVAREGEAVEEEAK